MTFVYYEFGTLSCATKLTKVPHFCTNYCRDWNCSPVMSPGDIWTLIGWHLSFLGVTFTGTTQDCATALLVVGPSPQGVSQLRYRLQLRCLHEAFPYLKLRYRLQLVASTRRGFHSYHTFYGHHPGLCNCPVSSWPFATGGISVEI